MTVQRWRVLHLGNTNNIGYLIVRALREAGLDADLVVDPSEHTSYHPSWMEPERTDPWVRYYSSKVRHGFPVGHRRVPLPFLHRLQQALDVARLEHEYDLLQAYNYDVILCLPHMSKPVVAFCVGEDLNVTALGRTWFGALLRLAYRRSGAVLYSNVDMLSAVNDLGLKNAQYMPLPVDTTWFHPEHEEGIVGVRERLGLEADFVCFSPARHDWKVKGNDKLIQAWKDVVRWANGQGLVVNLVLCAWGRDLLQSKELVEEQGLGEYVRWVPLMNKKLLRDWYWAADVVADQFNLKAFGLAALEAMACGKPVVASHDGALSVRFYGEAPAICAGASSERIAEQIKTLANDARLRRAVGGESRRWVEAYHSPKIIVERHVGLYRELLAGRFSRTGRVV